MPHVSKVFARVFTHTRGAGNSLDFVIEYTLTQGDARSGKVKINVTSLRDEKTIQDELKDELAEYLNNKYTPEVFTSNDIAGLGV